MTAGRPVIYDNPEILQNKVDEYFILCDDPDKPINKTITGLALHLGFCSRGTIYEYAKKPEFSDIINRALMKVENSYENRVGYSNNPTGAIFILKNMGWTDKQENINTNNSTHSFPDGINIKFTKA